MYKKFDIFDILVGKAEDPDYGNKPVVIQGITGNFGSVHTRLMREYGTNIVAGVTPNKGGQSFEGIPVFDSVKDASKNFNVQISGIFVPAQFFLSAIKDAVNSGIKLLVAIPEHVPVRDAMESLEYAQSNNARIIGP
ncbi:MAG TPA: CoA-binding protein, partial [Nitrososphaeraceae archaeon]|nr:CoA-binding protein [Nitrososphaeraceae archaeon]